MILTFIIDKSITIMRCEEWNLMNLIRTEENIETNGKVHYNAWVFQSSERQMRGATVKREWEHFG